MNKQEQAEHDAEQAAIAEYMASGGAVTICPPGLRTDPDLIANVWTRRGRPPAPKKPVNDFDSPPDD